MSALCIRYGSPAGRSRKPLSGDKLGLCCLRAGVERKKHEREVLLNIWFPSNKSRKLTFCKRKNCEWFIRKPKCVHLRNIKCLLEKFLRIRITCKEECTWKCVRCSNPFKTCGKFLYPFCLCLTHLPAKIRIFLMINCSPTVWE